MIKNKTYNKKKLLAVFFLAFLGIHILIGRLIYLMIFEAPYYQEQALALHQREREIKAARGKIIDCNGKVLATNRTVCTVSVIHSQIDDEQQVINTLCKELEMNPSDITKKVQKISSMEKIKTNVSKEVGDRIRAYNMSGVKVDDDFKRYYPYNTLASKVLGFTGGDNQGIIGLEVKYEDYLKGTNGAILTTTDATGIELEGTASDRKEPIDGDTLQISLDYNIQKYAEQAAKNVMEEKQADAVQIILMKPKTGEILAMVNTPEFQLDNPFELYIPEADSASLENSSATTENSSSSSAATMPQPGSTEYQDALNQMWRNGCINDTYEPGSTFKIITTSAALDAKVVNLDDSFSCPGYRVVGGRRIRCHKAGGHGSETFVEGLQNSCNPVFIDVGLRLGVDRFYDYFKQFGLLGNTGVDLPGEANTIMHKKEDIKTVELATMSFGQSFQITPIQMATTVSSLINGGVRVTPHLGVRIYDSSLSESKWADSTNACKSFEYETRDNVISKETSETLRTLLESVVSDGSGNRCYIEGYRIGGKTATSQTLPRSANRYISSFIGFAPANDPEILAIALVHDPKGIYYGGTIVAPVVREIFDNVLPYLGIEKKGTP